MSTPKVSRTKVQDYVFIFWGDRFEENATVTFATELRDAGLCVKVVGLAGQRSTGRYGIVLYSDVTLGDALALADRSICVVIPCSPPTMRRIENDPRVLTFLKQAHANHAQFIVSAVDTFENSSLKELAVPIDAITFYGECADLTAFARETANKLTNVVANL